MAIYKLFSIFLVILSSWNPNHGPSVSELSFLHSIKSISDLQFKHESVEGVKILFNNLGS